MTIVDHSYDKENGFGITHSDHTPSWKRPSNKGFAYAEFHIIGNRLSFSAREICQEGRWSSKEVMLTLDEAETLHLYEFLKAKLEK
jgi:hypothetical protein